MNLNAFGEGLVTILLAIVGVGLVSVLVSRNANTAGVIQAGASGFGNDLGVAESPVTGSHVAFSLGYPSPNALGNSFGSGG